MKYSGTKPYNQSFTHEGFKQADKSTKYTVKGLMPGSIYKFEIVGNSVCGDGAPVRLPNSVKTEMEGEQLKKVSMKNYLTLSVPKTKRINNFI